MEFFNNKENDKLKFKLNTEGVNTNTIDARLIFLTNENKNYLISGKIVEDVCEFEIPKLTLYENKNSGQIVFEIVSGDTYFRVWEDKFTIKSKKSIIVENVIEVKKKDTLKVQLITENKKEIEDKVIKKKEIKKYKDYTGDGFPTFGDVT